MGAAVSAAGDQAGALRPARVRTVVVYSASPNCDAIRAARVSLPAAPWEAADGEHREPAQWRSQ